jgi:hypothetical protein
LEERSTKSNIAMPPTLPRLGHSDIPARLIAAALCLLAAQLSTRAQGASLPLAERTRGAERVVVGRVAAVNPIWRTNEFGDRLIVSIVTVTVDETLRGPSQPSVDVEVEGGTIGDLTLNVSDLEPVSPGDRAVFYLARNTRGVFVPHLRGQGLLKLDRSDRVRNSAVTLADIRRAAQAR